VHLDTIYQALHDFEAAITTIIVTLKAWKRESTN